MAYTNWTDSEVFRLIQVWGEEGIQEQLEGAKRNKHIYEELAEDLVIYGIQKTGEQCRTKVKKLRQEYKKIADKHKETGQGRNKWKFFDKLNEFLGTRPATHPPKVLDTLDGSTIHAENDPQASISDEEHNQSDASGHNDDTDNTGDEGSNGASLNNLTTDVPPVEDIQSADKSTTSESSSSKVGRKRKRNKGEIMEEMMTKVMKSVTDSMQSSDRMFVELEERRMKFEAEQRKEEREFQLRLAQMLNASHSGHSSGFNYSYHPYSSSPPGEFYYSSDNS